MEGLSDAYLERLAAPTGLGDLAPADVAGEVGSVVGGSGVRVTLRLTADGSRIAAAAFRPFGSAAPLAPGSVLVERLPGLSLAEALAIEPRDLLEPLGGGLPAPVARGAEHLVEALHKALAGGDVPRHKARVEAPGVLVCRCLGVGDRVIRRAIRGGAADVEAVGRATAAGHGCHSCWPDLRAILDEETHPPAPPRARGGNALERAVDALVRPLWRAQGVTLGRVAVEAGVVRLEVAAVARDALASDLGAVALARYRLRETLGDAVRVEPIVGPACGGSPIAHVGPASAR